MPGRTLKTTFVRLLTALCGAFVLSGCGALLTLYASTTRHDVINHTERPNHGDDAFLTDMAERFGLMALFAEVVYRRDLPPDQRDGNGCRYLDPGAPPVEFGMPRDASGRGWKRWVPPPALREAIVPCIDEKGLYYETYILESVDGRLEKAVIAFRGTENRASQFVSDWGSNVTAFLGFEPPQYRLSRRHLPPLIEALYRRFDREGTVPVIHVTGHSLGGGLAQQAGYMSRRISEVFTFNTSPVTNWSHLRLDGAVENAYPIFHRIYHGGEILEKVRFISTAVTEARYGRHDIGLQLEPRSNVGGHQMKIIACAFAQQIAARGEDAGPADHHYPVSWINAVVLKDTGSAENKLCGPAD